MNKIDIIYKDININLNIEKKIKLLCNKIFDILDIINWELSIVICNNLFIKQLNKEYRGIDEPTDVLSFSQFEEHLEETAEQGSKQAKSKTISAGDIVISIDMVKQNAQEFKVDINEEFKRLILHGILHISGYTHANYSPKQKMLIFQEEIMQKLTGVKIL